MIVPQLVFLYERGDQVECWIVQHSLHFLRMKVGQSCHRWYFRFSELGAGRRVPPACPIQIWRGVGSANTPSRSGLARCWIVQHPPEDGGWIECSTVEHPPRARVRLSVGPSNTLLRGVTKSSVGSSNTSACHGWYFELSDLGRWPRRIAPACPIFTSENRPIVPPLVFPDVRPVSKPSNPVRLRRTPWPPRAAWPVRC